MTNIPSIAVIGCGYWGKNLVRNMAEIGALAAVVDANTEQAALMAQTYKVPARSFEDVLNDSAITGVVLAVPAPAHHETTIKALNAGKHVFVEKPLALTPKEGEEMCAAANAHNKILMVGHVLQFHAAFLEMQRWVKEGKLGKVKYIYSHRLNLGKVRLHENCWWSFAPHDVSMVLGLADSEAASVYASGMEALQSGIADIVNTTISFSSGMKAHIFVSWLNPVKEQRLTVVGEKGMLVFDDSAAWEDKLLFYPHRVEFGSGEPQVTKAEGERVQLVQSEPLKEECKAFLHAIATGIAPKTDGNEGLAVLKVLDGAERSMQSGKPLTIGSTASHSKVFIHDTAIVDEGCTIGQGSKIWHFSHILSGTTLGENVVVSQNVMIGPNVTVGNRCKIQNNVSLYKGVHLEDGVFCGPSCVFTNVNTPRAEIERKDAFLETRVGKAATIGANATIVCGNPIGAYALIGAGAVVTKPVKAHALMVGNPARQLGWVSHAGERLDETMTCPREGRTYAINETGDLIETTSSKDKTHDRSSTQKHVA